MPDPMIALDANRLIWSLTGRMAERQLRVVKVLGDAALRQQAAVAAFWQQALTPAPAAAPKARPAPRIAAAAAFRPTLVADSGPAAPRRKRLPATPPPMPVRSVPARSET